MGCHSSSSKIPSVEQRQKQNMYGNQNSIAEELSVTSPQKHSIHGKINDTQKKDTTEFQKGQSQNPNTIQINSHISSITQRSTISEDFEIPQDKEKTEKILINVENTPVELNPSSHQIEKLLNEIEKKIMEYKVSEKFIQQRKIYKMQQKMKQCPPPYISQSLGQSKLFKRRKVLNRLLNQIKIQQNQ